ncbi:MAG: AAA family ATPase [Deltaproteobacteria bacterium]|nr:AAA family ATPase [Deltaproteobacteria bacterium]
MAERLSREVRTIRSQADIVARATGRATGSVHYLVAMFVVECPARDVLVETGVTDQTVLDTYERMAERDDPPEALAEIHRQSQRLSESAGLPETTSMVLLASLLRVRDSLACRVLERAGVAVPSLRAKVIGQVTFDQDRGGTGLRQAVRPPEPEAPANNTMRTGDLRPLSDRPTTRTDLPRVDPTRPEPPRTALPTRPLPVLPAPKPKPEPRAERTAEQPPEIPPEPKPATKKVADQKVFPLHPDLYPTLNELGRNLTAAALAGEIETIIGRDTIIDALIDILLMKHANNPCLIGEAGVGKTAIAEGLALRLAGNISQYGKLGSAVVVEIPVSALLAGTGLRGAFSERMKKLRDEVAKAAGQVIVFMDEIHTLMGAGTGDGPLDAANDLKSALSRGKFPLIGATTKAEYQRHIESDPAMDRRFQVIEVPEPSAAEAVTILAGVAPNFGRHHGVFYQHEAVVSAVHLSKRFITDRCLPDKAISVLDRAGAQVRRAGREQGAVDDVARAVHLLTGVPMERLLADERGRIRDLAADLKARIVGHDRVLERISRRIQRNYAGFSGERPLASLLFVGAPGVGKTETARALAECLFVSGDALVRFDMSEYAEPHTVSRLLGSPPGYVGHQQVGLLAQALQKRPYRVLLFDEVDRAATEVQALLLQLLDAGRITDNHGHAVDVRNCLIVLTSNIGAELLMAGRRRSIGFGAETLATAGDDESSLVRQDEAVIERVRTKLSPELASRLDECLVFRPLDREAARVVARRAIDAGADRLYESRLIRYRADESVVDLVLEGGLDPALGVRPLRARIEAVVESFVTDCILDGLLKPGADVALTVHGTQLQLRPGPGAAAQVIQ